MVSVLKVVLPLLYSSFCGGLRKGKHSEALAEQGPRGRVDELYTFGGAGVFRALPTSECLPGMRIITQSKRSLTTTYDAVAAMFRSRLMHFKMAIGLADVQAGGFTNISCSDDTKQDPLGVPSFPIHPIAKYTGASASMPNRAGIMVKYANAAYEENPAAVNKRIGNADYRLVGTAVSQTTWKQITHLFQDPDTFGCVLTFHGTEGARDWAANFQVSWVDFCGLITPAHNGFVGQYRRMLKNPEFQSNIRPKLPFCAKLTLVGHSMGGALAELFASCLNLGPLMTIDAADLGFKKETPQKVNASFL